MNDIRPIPVLTDFDRIVLRLLHAFGPCGTRDITDRMRRNKRECNPDKVYRSLMRLTRCEKAVHPKRHLWYAVGGRRPAPSTTDKRRLRLARF